MSVVVGRRRRMAVCGCGVWQDTSAYAMTLAFMGGEGGGCASGDGGGGGLTLSQTDRLMFSRNASLVQYLLSECLKMPYHRA